jgi:uncharacterized membrane protein (UPF0127 family)
MVRFPAAIALTLSLCMTAMPWVASARAAERQPLTIATQNGPQRFKVEMALTDRQITRGLMFRRTLAERGGMLFDFHTDQTVTMWMKNTLLPLDMIFIRADGRVARIAANTTPQSTSIISSEEPVRAVLEVRGGTARKFGISPGDRVEHRMFPAR